MEKSKNIWMVATTVASLLAAKATQKVLDKGYKKVKKKDAPQQTQKMSSKDNTMKIVQWSLISGVLVSLAKLGAAQGVRKLWLRNYGETPPVK
ncbi:DUF4235 domain-containing protein [Chondrinema litorale]|uniref:DUF4235 domain-containing protein n=1 Tax=Chondrinema litorale TaxID=2994555 RepID=UPI002542F09F|nr:DUF4235 domain-containing protein [Chondrinema litorale]UZR98275.1 DUF4235 domain-containing protein [Chondrinema litorale]